MAETLPTPDEYKRYLEAMETAREYYRDKRFKEGWEWIVANSHLFPKEKQHELFERFMPKILNNIR